MLKLNNTPYQQHRFANGLRLVHRPQSGIVSHLAVMIHAGSRDESEQHYGVAHMIEHMLFKGTAKRKAYHIISRMENVGNDLNAYTTKEETCLHASFLPQYYGRTLELFSDVCFHSVFPENELAKEKEVVLDEIRSYEDSPADEILDDFENQIFAGHPLGHYILGTEESIAKLPRRALLDFIQKYYQPEHIVIASVGQISFDKLIKLIERHFVPTTAGKRDLQRQAPSKQQANTTIFEKDNSLCHGMIGNLAFPYVHPNRVAMTVLNHVLGGPMLNSRLNLNIREKYGFAYSIDSQYNAYSDTGWFGVNFGTSAAHLEKVLKLIHKELDRLRNEKLGILQLKSAKQQMAVQLALSLESGLTETLHIARSVLLEENVPSMTQLLNEVYAVNANDLLSLANEVFDPATLSTLIFKSES